MAMTKPKSSQIEHRGESVQKVIDDLTQQDGTLDANPSWEDIPKLKGANANKQAQALANRVEALKHGEIMEFRQDSTDAPSFPIIMKARQWLHNEDYNFLPDSGDVTEEALKTVSEAKRQKKKLHIAAGRFKVYSELDPGGIEIEGTLGGWRNAAGTIIEGDGTNHSFRQLTNTTDKITYSVKNIHVENALSVLKVGYGAFVTAEHLTGVNVKQGILLSDPSTYGVLWCALRQCNIVADEEALVIEGSTVANANLIDTCYFMGGQSPVSESDFIPAARINGGGYGALANTLINTEFAGQGIGVKIGRGAATKFINGYFETEANSICIDGYASVVDIDGGVFGNARNTKNTPSSFVWHKSGSTTLNINSPTVFLDKSDGSQANMRFIHSSATASLVPGVILPIRLHNNVSAPGWKVFGEGLPTNLGNVNGNFDYTPELTAGTGGAPSVGTGYVVGKYTQIGRQIQVNIEIVFGDGMTSSGGTWMLNMPFNLLNRAVGNVRIFRPGVGVKSGIAVVGANNRQAAMYVSDNANPIGGTVPWTWQSGDTISIDISGTLA